MERIKAAVVQICSTEDVAANLQRAGLMIREAAKEGAELITLPENVGRLRFGPSPDLGEALESSIILGSLRALASELRVAILVGSLHRISPDPNRAFNTSVLIDRDGVVIASYDKIHLFDIDLPGQVSMRESDDLTPGAEVVVAKLGEIQIGLSICYDLRFPELYRQQQAQGAEVIAIPAAFTMQTGRDHWDLLVRARAVENQCYVLAPNQWGRHGGKRHSYGHSMIVDPWGQVLASVPDGEGWAAAWLEPAELKRVRRVLPCGAHRRL